MSDENGRRIYGSARDLIRIYRLDPGRIEGTGKDGAVGKGDVRRHLRGEGEEAPNQSSMILYGVAEGLSNAEIAERIKAANPDSGISPGHIPTQVGKERRRASAWWEDPEVQEALREHRPALKGVEAPEMKAAASSQPADS